MRRDGREEDGAAAAKVQVERVGEPGAAAVGVGKRVSGGDWDTHKKPDAINVRGGVDEPTIQLSRSPLGCALRRWQNLAGRTGLRCRSRSGPCPFWRDSGEDRVSGGAGTLPGLRYRMTEAECTGLAPIVEELVAEGISLCGLEFF